MTITIDKELCLGCGCCSDACAVGALELIDEKAAVNEDDCVECKSCIDLCPTCAIRVP